MSAPVMVATSALQCPLVPLTTTQLCIRKVDEGKGLALWCNLVMAQQHRVYCAHWAPGWLDMCKTNLLAASVLQHLPPQNTPV